METTSETKVTPDLAIFRAIMTLRKELSHWKESDDPHGVVASIQEEIVALEQARTDVKALKAIRAAFALM